MKKRKILLILPKEDMHSEAIVKIKSLPFSILCLGTYLINKGHKVKLIDLKFDKIKITKEMVEEYDFFGFSVMSADVRNALELSRKIKQINPEKQIIWGGVHPSLYPEQCRSEKSIDYAVVGEGEKALLAIVNGKAKKGIVKSNEFIDIGEISPLRWDLLDIERYTGNFKGNKSLALHTGRGCPFKCAFCINTVISQKYRALSAKKILNEMKILKERYGIRHFRLNDENFFVDKKKTRAIVNALKGKDITWDAQCRADYFNDDYLGKNYLPLSDLRKSGCILLLIGVESGSQRVLDLLCKGTTVEQNVHAVTECAKNDIVCITSYMCGLPGETKSDLIKTLNQINYLIKVCKGKLAIQGPHPYRPYPGSLLYNKVKKYLDEPKTLDGWATRGTFSGFMPIEKMDWVKNPQLFKRINFYGKNAPFSYIPGETRKKLIFRWFSRRRFRYHFFNFPFETLIAERKNFRNFIKKLKEFFIIV